MVIMELDTPVEKILEKVLILPPQTPSEGEPPKREVEEAAAGGGPQAPRGEESERREGDEVRRHGSRGVEESDNRNMDLTGEMQVQRQALEGIKQQLAEMKWKAYQREAERYQ